MKKKIGFFLFILIVISTIAKSQSSFYIKNAILLKGIQNKVLHIVNADIAHFHEYKINDIAVAPYYQVTYKTDINLSDSLSFLYPDSTIFFGLIHKNDIATGIVKRLDNSKTGFFVKLIDSLAPQNVNDLKKIRMVEYAKKYSNNLFFIKLLLRGNEEGSFSPLGFQTKNSTQFIDTNLHVYSNLSDLINNRYGSMEKYLELLSDENEISNLTKNFFSNEKKRIEYCKEILRKDYKTATEYCAGDTEKVIRLFIVEADSLLRLNSYQRIILKSKLFSCLIKKEHCPKYQGQYDGVFFYGYDISKLLKSVFTRNQYAEYFYKREMLESIAVQAGEFLNDFYMNKLDAKNTFPNSTMIISIDEGKIKEAIKNDVFY